MMADRAVATAPPADARPLFIVGCVRSGTTLTRDLLRRVPGFICPEETHFMRWADPFRTPSGMAPLRSNRLLRDHRRMDGVSEEDFTRILRRARSKADLQRMYVTAFATAQGITGPYRWFDKTPQNVYAVPLILAQFPRARLLHLVRNPLNVVASLKLGRQVSVPDLHGAINYWREAVQIMAVVRRAHRSRVLTLRYEDLVADVPAAMSAILRFADVSHPEGLYSPRDAHAERNLWRSALTEREVTTIRRQLGGLARRMGYDLNPDAGAQDAGRMAG